MSYTPYTPKSCRVVLFQDRSGGGWFWRLVDFFGAVVGEADAVERRKKDALRHGHKAAHDYAADMRAQIVKRKAGIATRMETKPWPSNWKRLTKEHGKLSAVERTL